MSQYYGNTSPSPKFTKADPSTRNGGGPPNPNANFDRGGPQDTIDCPNCGTPVGNLGKHIGSENCTPESAEADR